MKITLEKGKLFVLKGPNGCGKTTLAKKMATENKEIFLGFQESPAISGVTYRDLLNLVAKDKTVFPDEFLDREIGGGLSGGEKRMVEIYQALAIKPKFAVFDEPDAGVDPKNLKVIIASIKALQKNSTGILVITHSENLIKLLKPDKIYVKSKDN